jgi:competence protein ComEC
MGLIWIGAAWLAGIALGYGRDLRPWWPVALWLGVAMGAAAALLPRQRRLLLWGTAGLAILTLATWRTSLIAPTVADLPAGTIVAVRGQVADWPVRGDRSDTAIVAVEEARVGDTWYPASARVRVDLPLAPAAWRGDRLELTGYYRSLEQIDLPSFRDWLAQRQLHGQFRAFSSRVLAAGDRGDIASRRFALLGNVEERLRRAIPGAEGALATGILLGDDNLLPKATRDAFNATSTSHTMALSGWNITIVAWLCAWIGQKLRRSRSVWWLGGSALAIWAFVFFVGPGPTLVRAAIMGSACLVAELAGRRNDTLTALLGSAFLMTAYDPAALLDIGFQLSCAATAGLILLAPTLTGLLKRLRLPGILALGMATTMAAEISTFPLILHHFGRLSRLTLPANLLIEPLVPAIMFSALAAALVSIIPIPLVDFAGYVVWIPARLMLLAVETLGALPWATQPFPAIGWTVTFGFYGALALGVTVPRWSPPGMCRARGQPWHRSGLGWPVASRSARGCSCCWGNAVANSPARVQSGEHGPTRQRAAPGVQSWPRQSRSIPPQ